MFKITDHQRKNGYDDILRFDLLNNSKDMEIPVALVNGIRRSILQYVPVVCFERDSVEFKKNSSMLHDEMLSHRLISCPISVKGAKNYDLGRLEFFWEKENENDYMQSFYLGEAKVVYDGKELSDKEVTQLLPFPGMILGNLRTNQGVSMKAKAIQTTGEEQHQFKGVAESAIVFYSFKRDQTKIAQVLKDGDTSQTPGIFGEEILPRKEDEDNFLKSKANKHYLKTSNEQPAVYQFEIEGAGFYEPYMAFRNGILILRHRLNIIKEAIETNIVNKAKIVEAPNNAVQWDLVMTNEDDTLGNLLATFAQMDYGSTTKYGGYVIPHPLDKRVVVRVELMNKNEEADARKYYLDTIARVSKILDAMDKEWGKVMPK